MLGTSVDGHGVHALLEFAAYVVGARIYWAQVKRRQQALVLPDALGPRLTLLAGAIFGAFLGSKALHIAEHWPALVAANQLELWIGGKSVLGGFLGGTLGVEYAKRQVNWSSATGDAWVPALAAGLMVGRLGCQFSGVWDQTYGIETSVPWAWNYGDGLARHPVALYEVLLIAGVLGVVMRWSRLRPNGAQFAAFMLAYCAIRLGLECLKPPYGASAAGTLPVAWIGPLTAIQWAALAGAVGFAALLRLRLRAGHHGQD